MISDEEQSPIGKKRVLGKPENNCTAEHCLVSIETERKLTLVVFAYTIDRKRTRLNSSHL